MSPWWLVAVATAASAAGLLVPVGPRVRATRSGWPGRARWLVPLCSAAVVAAALLDRRLVGLLVVAVIAVMGGSGLLRRRVRRRSVDRRRARVAEACELLAAELIAGQPPAAALERAAREWPDLEPVATAAALGADVPTAWRLLAGRPGSTDLRLVAAAWQVAQASGAGLADAVARVTARAREVEATRRVVGSELASARATARLMAALPILALMMGSGVGGNPWTFLFLTVPGLLCLGGGLVLGLAGLWWIEVIADGVDAAV